MPLTLDDRLAIWRRAFEEDENAIVPSLVTTAWNHAVFMTVVKAVELAPLNADGEKQLNWSVLGLLKTSYWGSTVLAIRRLVDGGAIRGGKGVASLRSILNDIRAARPEITRRAYVEIISELEYDARVVEQKSWDYLLAQPGPVWMPQDLDYRSIDRRHEQFDFLSGVGASERSPDDLVREGVFERLEGRLKKLDTIADHATIYFAHAATEESRKGRGVSTFGASDAVEALKVLTETAELIGSWFLYRNVFDILPTPQEDPFRFLDKPLLQAGDTQALNDAWDQFAAQTQTWYQVGADDL